MKRPKHIHKKNGSMLSTCCTLSFNYTLSNGVSYRYIFSLCVLDESNHFLSSRYGIHFDQMIASQT